MENKFYIAVSIIIIVFIILSIILSMNKKEIDLTKGTIDGITYKETSEESEFIKIVANNKDVILVELDKENAPITVENFKKLVSKNYYDKTLFHRIIDGFMIQGGQGKTIDNIVGEFKSNGYDNNLKHTAGVISMARAADPDSASSGFFICVNDTGCAHLDGEYAGFGKVIAGLKTVVAISKVQTTTGDKPVKEVEITSVTFVEVERDK